MQDLRKTNNTLTAYRRAPAVVTLKADLIDPTRSRRYNVRELIALNFTQSMLEKGLIVVGRPGSGKTTSVFMKAGSQLIDHLGPDDKLIILDVKGEYTERFANDDTIVIGRNSYDHVWNIYTDILAFGKSEINIRAGEVAEYLFMDQVAIKDPFWVNAAKILLKKILIFHIRRAMETRDMSRLNNAALSEFISSLTVDKLLDLLDSYEDFAECKMLLGSADNGSLTNQGISVLSELVVMRDRIFNGAFCEDGDFSMSDFIRSGSGVLILQMDMSTFHFFKSLFKYLIDISISTISSPSTKTGRIYYLLDEFAMLPKLNNLSTAVALLRSNKCSIICGIQSIEQVDSTYNSGDTQLASVILDVFQNIIIMRSSAASANFIQQHFGEREATTYYTKADGSLGERSERRPALDVNDIIYLDTGEAYMKLENMQPFKVKFPK